MFPDAWIEANSKLHLFIVLVGWEHIHIYIYIYIMTNKHVLDQRLLGIVVT